MEGSIISTLVSHQPFNPRTSGWVLLTLLVLLQVQFVGGVADYQAEVFAREWVRYQVSGDLSEGVTSSYLEVQSVEASNVTVRFIDFYSDGTSQDQTLWLDASSGTGGPSGRFPSGFFFLTLGGLTPGDKIYSLYSYQVNVTKTESYGGAERVVNVLDVRVGTSPTGRQQYFWDSSKGILAEIRRTYVPEGGEQRDAIRSTLVETNMWGPETPGNADLPYQFWLLVAGLPLLLLSGVLIVKRRRRH